MIDGDPEERWRDCRVLDVTPAGAGLRLVGATPEETAGRRIVLVVRLRGDVRYARPEGNDELRAGVQFVELTNAERIYLQSLADLAARW
jgi:hypothetical protein